MKRLVTLKWVPDFGGKVPSGDEIRAAREAAGLSRAQAAALIHRSVRSLEKDETGERTLHPGLWELLSFKLPIASRFHKKVEIPDDPEACWLWTGARYKKDGYGSMLLTDKTTNAHRVAYELYIGLIPESFNGGRPSVCHTCDNKLCVNPKHLFLGTQSDNLLDASKKGRLNKYRGRKLITAQAEAIKIDPRRHEVIAAEYGISANHVYQIKAGLHWRPDSKRKSKR